MVKIGGGNRITISSEIMELKGWKVGTEVIIFPVVKNDGETLTKDTPIEIREVPKGGDSKNE